MYITNYVNLEAAIIHRQSGLLTLVKEDYMFDFKTYVDEANRTLSMFVYPLRLYAVVPDELTEGTVAFYKALTAFVKGLAILYMKEMHCTNVLLCVYGSPLKRPYQFALEDSGFKVRTRKETAWEWRG